MVVKVMTWNKETKMCKPWPAKATLDQNPHKIPQRQHTKRMHKKQNKSLAYK